MTSAALCAATLWCQQAWRVRSGVFLPWYSYCSRWLIYCRNATQTQPSFPCVITLNRADSCVPPGNRGICHWMALLCCFSSALWSGLLSSCDKLKPGQFPGKISPGQAFSWWHVQTRSTVRPTCEHALNAENVTPEAHLMILFLNSNQILVCLELISEKSWSCGT